MQATVHRVKKIAFHEQQFFGEMKQNLKKLRQKLFKEL